MRKFVAITAACFCTVEVGRAAETISYSYDALGRLVQVQISGGPANGVLQSYQYDLAGNRTQYQISDSQGQTPVTLSVSNTVANATSTGVALTVNVSGSSPGGIVTFTENGVFLGSAWVIDGQASILLEGFPNGTHTITASYSGDDTHAPQTATFTIKVQDLSWLPAVLDLLLSD